MFLSRIVLPARAVSAQEFAELGMGLGALHRLIWLAFGDQPDRERDFLYRADREGDRWTFMTLSAREPGDWGGRLLVESRPFAPTLSEGQRLGFSLRANATVAAGAHGKRGKRHDVVMHLKCQKCDADEVLSQAELVQEAGFGWLAKRGELAGAFEVHDGEVLADAYTQHVFTKRAGGTEVRLSTLDLTGQLTVRDPLAMRQLLFNGLGAAKAYGNGLMLIRPL